MTPPSIGPFCKSCTALDVPSLLYVTGGSSERPPSIPLGSLEDVVRRSDHCPLCSLISQALIERYKRTPSRHLSDSTCSESSSASEMSQEEDEIDKYGMPVTSSNTPIDCSITPNFFCRQDHPGNFEETAVNIFRLTIALSTAPWGTSSSTDAVTLHAVWEKDGQTKDATEISTQAFSPVGSGRKVGPNIDLSTVRGWLRQCEDVHGHTCASPNWASNSHDQWNTVPLRVIDVKERRIVHLPPQGRYVALSYVWGHNGEELGFRWSRCLTTQNRAQLQELNGLDLISLPETIRDAMSLTSDLEERYLWVDALCILQDDINDLDAQTSRMDLVYSGALLTILAACGSNSESGLAGMPGKPRDIFHRSIPISPNGLCLATTASLSDLDSVHQSVWNKRGWTFQERLLSRRTLFITPSQIYWRCESSMWDEETILEPTEPKTWVLPQALKCNDEWDDGDPKFSKQALSTYITQYNTRKLTFPSDAYSAFLGIARRYEHLHGEEVSWGIPTARLDQSLTWKYGTDRRKELQPVLLDGSVHHVPYPSWSWLGWDGFIVANIHNRYLRSKSELVFYSLMSDGTVRSFHGPGSVGDDPQQPSAQPAEPDSTPTTNLAPSWKGDTTIIGPIKVPDEEIISKLDPLEVLEKRLLSLSLDTPIHDTGRLVFRTSHAQVKGRVTYDSISIKLGDEVLKLEANIPYRTVQEPGPVSEDSDALAGGDAALLILQSELANLRDRKAPRDMVLDLIVISRFYEISQPKDTGKLNIMIVNKTEFQPGVWSRHGLAVIQEKDWLRFERTWDTIILA